MRITFHGAAQEVTGSMHLVEVNGARILLECGLFQGRRAETYQRNLNLPFDPREIDAVILSHAHIDHSGKLPNLVKQGFAGNVWSTAATRNLSTYMLLDSGHIQESDAAYLNKKRKKADEPPIEPLYTRSDAQAALSQFVSIGRHRTVSVADGVQLTFYNSGHILGSAFVVLDIQENATGKKWRLVFSGDVGREELAILPSPEAPPDADILIMESTYGDRIHQPLGEARRELRDVVCSTARRRGKVIIPAFAVGRTQEIVFALNELEADGDIPALPIFVDSPLAVSATEVFRMHPEEWDEEVQAFLSEESRRNPFDAAQIEYVRDVKRSKQLNYLAEPAIIVSPSGMAENGRILHHLKNNIEDASNTILFVSFQAEHTLGRKIMEGQPEVLIFGEAYRVKAHVASIEGYSAHADSSELIEWASHMDGSRIQHAFLVHGEPPASSALKGKLQDAGWREVNIPSRGQTFEF